MKRQQVIDRLREVTEEDFAKLHDNSEVLLKESRRFSGYMHEKVGYLLTRGPEAFRSDSTSAGPGSYLLGLAYSELPNKKRRLSNRALRFISEMALPLAGLDGQAPSHKAALDANPHTGSCGDAEHHFRSALTQVNTGRLPSIRHFYQSRVSVYHNEAGLPILFRKKRDESTALTLMPLSSGKMDIPRGTIVAVNHDMNNHLTGERKRNWFTMSTYLVPDKVPLYPLRPSAWAHDDPIDRALLAITGQVGRSEETFRYYSNDARMLARTSLEDFIAAGQKVVELCAD